jgi:hypothetical protein
MAALPSEEFPFLAQTADDARAVPPEDEFSAGLDVILDGLANRAAPKHDS